MSNKAKREGNAAYKRTAHDKFEELCDAALVNQTYGRISIHAIFENGVIQTVGEATEITHKLDAA